MSKHKSYKEKFLFKIIQPTPHKTPKTSPPVIDAVSCSSGGPSPVTNHNNSSIPLAQTPNSNNSSNVPNIPPTPPNSNSSNGILAVTPKIEHSPPISQSQYERQTVLMWGASNNSSRSPNTTPTSNGVYQDVGHLASSNKQTPLSNQISPASEDSHHAVGLSSHLKWNGITKDVPGVHVYPLHQHHDLNVDHSAAMYQQALQHHSGGHLDHSAALHQATAGSNAQNNCEVWTPPSYSQYQYFAYHHAPQHHASTQ